MAEDSYGMGIPLPADTTKVHQFPGVTRLAMERVAEILAGGITPAVEAAVAAAAGEAVDGALAAEDVITGDSPRLPVQTPAEDFRIRDTAGKVAFSVDGKGQSHMGTTTFRENGTRSTRIVDAAGKIAFEIDGNGIVVTGGAAQATTAVHILISAGQSNTGRGKPTTPELDPQDSRILMFGAKSRTIATATTPLDQQDTEADGLGHITVIAREYLKTVAPGTVVLLVPSGYGGTRLSMDKGPTSARTDQTWRSTQRGSLYDAMIDQTKAAVTAATAKWGFAPQIKLLAWHQGESDAMAAVPAATYQTDLDALIANTRADLGIADLPVLVGGMVPEWVAGNALAEAIQGVHIATPARVVRTSYTPGVANAGGAAGNDDVIHYTRHGQVELGRRMFTARDRALVNTAASIPVPPLTVAATLVAGALTVEWAAPQCRYTDFLVEYSANNGAWTAITGRPLPADTKATATGLASPVRVRVSTINPNGTSRATTPVTAIGA